jgi:hypothetical protein
MQWSAMRCHGPAFGACLNTSVTIVHVFSLCAETATAATCWQYLDRFTPGGPMMQMQSLGCSFKHSCARMIRPRKRWKHWKRHGQHVSSTVIPGRIWWGFLAAPPGPGIDFRLSRWQIDNGHAWIQRNIENNDSTWQHTVNIDLRLPQQVSEKVVDLHRLHGIASRCIKTDQRSLTSWEQENITANTHLVWLQICSCLCLIPQAARHGSLYLYEILWAMYHFSFFVVSSLQTSVHPYIYILLLKRPISACFHTISHLFTVWFIGRFRCQVLEACIASCPKYRCISLSSCTGAMSFCWFYHNKSWHRQETVLKRMMHSRWAVELQANSMENARKMVLSCIVRYGTNVTKAWPSRLSLTGSGGLVWTPHSHLPLFLNCDVSPDHMLIDMKRVKKKWLNSAEKPLLQLFPPQSCECKCLGIAQKVFAMHPLSSTLLALLLFLDFLRVPASRLY